MTDPRQPKLLSEFANKGGQTHGMEMDDKYVYLCGTMDTSKPRNEEVIIIDYTVPEAAKVAGTFHVMGQHEGETFSAMNQKNPNGLTDQFITCHEIIKDGNRLYLAYRDAGIIILDISDPTKPVEIGNMDYVPPYNGDPGVPLGCCPGGHTAAPVPHAGKPLPNLLILTDEHFSCPPGFVQIVDISNPKNMMVISNIQIEGVADQYDHATGKFVCKAGQQSAHLPWFDPRSHGALFYQAWYDQGLRAFDISNPFRPKEVGYFISPDFSIPQQVGRHTREAYADPATNLDLCHRRQRRRGHGPAVYRPDADQSADPRRDEVGHSQDAGSADRRHRALHDAACLRACDGRSQGSANSVRRSDTASACRAKNPFRRSASKPSFRPALRSAPSRRRPAGHGTARKDRQGRIVSASWDGGTIPPGHSLEFGVVARNPQTAATLTWKAIQKYQDASEVHWIGASQAQFPAAMTRVQRSARAASAVACSQEAKPSSGAH